MYRGSEALNSSGTRYEVTAAVNIIQQCLYFCLGMAWSSATALMHFFRCVTMNVFTIRIMTDPRTSARQPLSPRHQGTAKCTESGTEHPCITLSSPEDLQHMPSQKGRSHLERLQSFSPHPPTSKPFRIINGQALRFRDGFYPNIIRLLNSP